MSKLVSFLLVFIIISRQINLLCSIYVSKFVTAEVKYVQIPSCLYIMVNVSFVKVFDSSLDAVIHSCCAAFGADASYLM